MTKTDQTDRARQLILDAALKLFSSKGFAATSTKEIAKEAGLSEGLIFHHFGNKLAVFKALKVPERTLEGMLGRINAESANLPTAEWIGAIAMEFSELFRTDGALLNLLIAESRIDDQLFLAFKNILGGGLASIAGELERRKALGMVAESRDPLCLAESIIGALFLHFIMNRKLEPQAWNRSSEELAGRLSKLA